MTAARKTLFELVNTENLETIQSLIKLNLHNEIIQGSQNGHTALTISARNGNLDLVRLLVANKANLEHKTMKYKATALAWALDAYILTERNSPDDLETKKYRYWDINADKAKRKEVTKIILFLIDQGANIYDPSIDGELNVSKMADPIKSLIETLREYKKCNEKDKKNKLACELAKCYGKLEETEKEYFFHMEACNGGYLESLLIVGQYAMAFDILKQNYASATNDSIKLEILNQIEKMTEAKNTEERFFNLRLDCNLFLINAYLQRNNLDKIKELILQMKNLLTSFQIRTDSSKSDILTVIESLSGQELQSELACTLIKNIHELNQCKDKTKIAKLAQTIGAQLGELKKPDQATQYFKIAAENGDADGMLHYAVSLIHQKQSTEAVRWLEKKFALSDKSLQSAQPIIMHLKSISKAERPEDAKDLSNSEPDSRFNALMALGRINLNFNFDDAYDDFVLAKKQAEQFKIQLKPDQVKFLNAVSHFAILVKNKNVKEPEENKQQAHNYVAEKIQCVHDLQEACSLKSIEAQQLISLLANRNASAIYIKIIFSCILANLTSNKAKIDELETQYGNFFIGLCELYGLNNTSIMPQKAIKTFEKALKEDDANRLDYDIHLNMAFAQSLLAIYAEKEDKKNRIAKAVEVFNKLYTKSISAGHRVIFNTLLDLFSTAEEIDDKLAVFKSLCEYQHRLAITMNTCSHEYQTKVIQSIIDIVLNSTDTNIWKYMIEMIGKTHKLTNKSDLKSIYLKQLLALPKEHQSSQIRYAIEITLSDCFSCYDDQYSLVKAIEHYEQAEIIAKQSGILLEKRPDIYQRYSAFISKNLSDVATRDCDTVSLNEAKLTKVNDSIDKAVANCIKALNLAFETNDDKSIKLALEQARELKNNLDLSTKQTKQIDDAIHKVLSLLQNSEYINNHFECCAKLFEIAKCDYPNVYEKSLGIYLDISNLKQLMDSVSEILKSKKDNEVIASLMTLYLNNFNTHDAKDKRAQLILTKNIEQFVLEAKSIRIMHVDMIPDDIETTELFNKLLPILEESLSKNLLTNKSIITLGKLSNLYFFQYNSNNAGIRKTGTERDEVIRKQIEIYLEIYRFSPNNIYVKAIQRNLKNIILYEKHNINLIEQAQKVLNIINFSEDEKELKFIKAAARENYLPAVFKLAQHNKGKLNWLAKKRVDRPLYLYAKTLLLSLNEPESKEKEARVAEARQFISAQKPKSDFVKFIQSLEKNVLRLLQSPETQEGDIIVLLHKDPDAFMFKALKAFCMENNLNYTLTEKILTQSMEKALLDKENSLNKIWVNQKKCNAFQLQIETAPPENNVHLSTRVEPVNPSAPLYYEEFEPGNISAFSEPVASPIHEVDRQCVAKGELIMNVYPQLDNDMYSEGFNYSGITNASASTTCMLSTLAQVELKNTPGVNNIMSNGVTASDTKSESQALPFVASVRFVPEDITQTVAMPQRKSLTKSENEDALFATEKASLASPSQRLFQSSSIMTNVTPVSVQGKKKISEHKVAVVLV